MLKETLMDLCRLPGVSGREDAVRDYIAKELGSYADEMITDAMGNLLLHIPGARKASKKVMLAAHMDEVGIIITGFTEDGYLKFDFVGGVDRRVVIGKQVFVGDQAIPGVIGLKAVHLVSPEESSRIPRTKEMYVDIGADSKKEAQELVALGDVGTFDLHVQEFGSGFLRAKAIDDRVGCALMVELTKGGLPVDCWLAFTVQEEVGTRGAMAAAYRLQPDTALILEGTTAADLPSQKGNEKVCAPGHGPVIPFMDGGTIYDRGLFRQLSSLAEANGIPWQTKTWISGGTDASAVQRSGVGAHVAAISAAVRYIHSPSCVGCLEDFDHMEKLVRAYLETL